MHALQFKKDWTVAAERWAAWWRRDYSYDAFISIGAPRKEPLDVPEPERHDSRPPEWHWTSPENLIPQAEYRFGRTAYIGQTFPYTCASLGPGAFGVYVGAEPVFEPTTIWYEPCIDDITSDNILFDRSGQWWQWTLETTRKMVEASDNQRRYLVAMPDLVENADTLAALVGTEELLYAMADQPEHVLRLQEELLPLWYQAFDGIYDLIKDEDGGMAFIAFQIWAPGKLAKLQCDYSAMISPAMFEKFVLPYLIPQAEWLDYSIYHLDGPDAVCHLELLMTIDGLDCLQWTPGAGNPDGGDPCWDRIYRTALDCGKMIHVSSAKENVIPFLKRFGKKDVYILTHTESEEEGRELLEEVRNL